MTVEDLLAFALFSVMLVIEVLILIGDDCS